MDETKRHPLLRAERSIGMWLLTASAVVTEAVAQTPLDFLVLDLEHAPIPPTDVAAHAAAVELAAARRGADTPALVVRLADQSVAAAKQALDGGARAIMFPFVETADEARAIADACRYPPAGRRGFARVVRAGRYGADPGYTGRANAEVAVIAQLETPEALVRLEAIAGIPGIDALFVGPGDISATLGVPGDIRHASVRRALADAFARGRAAGKPVGTVLPTVEDVAWAFGEGCAFAAVGSDLAAVTDSARRAAGALRAGGSA